MNPERKISNRIIRPLRFYGYCKMYANLDSLALSSDQHSLEKATSRITCASILCYRLREISTSRGLKPYDNYSSRTIQLHVKKIILAMFVILSKEMGGTPN